MCALFDRDKSPSSQPDPWSTLSGSSAHQPLFGVFGDIRFARETGIHRASEVERRAFEQLGKSGVLEFEQMNAIAGYFGATEFQVSVPAEMPQASALRHFHAVKPEPVRTPYGDVYEVYRLTLACSAHDPSIILRAAISPQHLKLGSDRHLTAELGNIHVGESPIREWMLMVAPGESMRVDREVFGQGIVRLAPFGFVGCSGSEQPLDWAIGTTKSLGLIGLPGRLHMVNRAVGQADTVQAFIGTWRPTITAPCAGGQRIDVSFERERGLLTDRAVTICNNGSVMLKLWFDLPPRQFR
jgi:hypothetical protein